MDYGRLLNSSLSASEKTARNRRFRACKGISFLCVLARAFAQREKEIQERLRHFKSVYNWPEQKLFCELVFCILTPQSRAKNCDKAVQELNSNGVLWKGNPKRIAKILKSRGVRFYNNKARYLVAAREQFFNGSTGLRDSLQLWKSQSQSPIELRNFVYKNIKGLGLKEASHFLRNIGLAEELAILDRHILKNLVKYRVVREIPKSLTAKKYYEIEQKLFKFAEKVGIHPAALDLLLWSEETGEVFK